MKTVLTPENAYFYGFLNKNRFLYFFKSLWDQIKWHALYLNSKNFLYRYFFSYFWWPYNSCKALTSLWKDSPSDCMHFSILPVSCLTFFFKSIYWLVISLMKFQSVFTVLISFFPQLTKSVKVSRTNQGVAKTKVANLKMDIYIIIRRSNSMSFHFELRKDQNIK